MAQEHQFSKQERAAEVLRFKAFHPTWSSRQIAQALGISHQTVLRDIKAAGDAIIGEAADTYRTIVLTGYFAIIEAHLPRAVGGDHKSANVCIAANKEIASLLGLNAVTKQSVSVEIRKLIEALPPVPGLSVDDAVAEAERILAGIGGE